MLRIAIVDDHQIVRAGFREMFADESGIELAFDAGSGEEARRYLRESETDSCASRAERRFRISVSLSI